MVNLSLPSGFILARVAASDGDLCWPVYAILLDDVG